MQWSCKKKTKKKKSVFPPRFLLSRLQLPLFCCLKLLSPLACASPSWCLGLRGVRPALRTGEACTRGMRLPRCRLETSGRRTFKGCRPGSSSSSISMFHHHLTPPLIINIIIINITTTTTIITTRATARITGRASAARAKPRRTRRKRPGPRKFPS